MVNNLLFYVLLRELRVVTLEEQENKLKMMEMNILSQVLNFGRGDWDAEMSGGDSWEEITQNIL